jgi:DNA-binding transcriptional LysR family regulator
MAHPTDPSLVAKRLGSLAFACYAATTDHRTFDTIDLLAYGDDSGSGLLEQFLLDLVPRERIVMRSNSMQALLVAVRTGAGCCLLPCFSAEGDPALRRVSTPHKMAPLPLWLVYHEDLRRSPRVRVAVSFVEEVVNNNRNALVPVTLGS